MSLLCGLHPWKPLADISVVDLKIVDIDTGCNHTIALDSIGQVWTWGCQNKHMQLGRADVTSLEPQIVSLPENIIWQRVINLISCGDIKLIYCNIFT